MNRRIFEETIQSLKSQLMESTKRFFEDQGIAFDVAAYENQASFDLDATVRELTFFGANSYPDDISIEPKPALTLAA